MNATVDVKHLLRLLAVLSLLPGCYGKVNNTGLQGELSLGLPDTQNGYGIPQRDQDATKRPVAVGAPIVREVFRYTNHWSSCSIDDQGCGSLTPALAKLELVSCECPDQVCSCALAEPGRAGVTQRLQLSVTGLREARSLLRVKVKADGDDVEDTFPVEFRTAARIGVYGRLEQGASTRYASMPGASFDLLPVLEAADGTQLVTDGAAWKATAAGSAIRLASTPDVFTPREYEGYPIGAAVEALAPGRGTVRFQAAGLARDVELRVGDYQAVVGFELHASPPEYGAGSGSSRILDASLDTDRALDADPLGDPLAEIDLVGPWASEQVTTVLRLADGTKALGGAASLRATGAGIVRVGDGSREAFDSQLAISAEKVGATTLVSALAPEAAGIPVVVEQDPSQP